MLVLHKILYYILKLIGVASAHSLVPTKYSQAEWLKLFSLVVTTKVCILHVCIILTCYTPHHLIKLIPYQAIIIDNFYIGSCSKNGTLLIIRIQHRLWVSSSMNINEMPFYQHDPFTSA